LAGACAHLRITAALPPPSRVAELRASLDEARVLEEVADRVRTLAKAHDETRSRAALLNALPDAPPVLESTAEAEEALATSRSLATQAARARTRLAGLDEAMASLRADLARLLDDTQGCCPTCGSVVDPDLLLSGHGHAGHAPTGNSGAARSGRAHADAAGRDPESLPAIKDPAGQEAA